MYAMDERDEIRRTAEDDAAIESAVLQQVLDLHPASLTLAELVREMGEEGAGSEAIGRAVRDLVGAGLLHHGDAFVRPTRAALRFEQLIDA
jgi:hypothetical protein